MASTSETEQPKPAMTIPKAISLIKHKHSCEMIERHVRALQRIAHSNRNGFLLRDLSDLCQLITICAERLHRTPEYQQPLCKLVELCSLPFLKEKVSDENTYAPSVIETMTLLGKLAKGSSDALRWEVARAVAAFYSKQPDKAHLEGLQMTRLTFNAVLVERSAVAKSLVEALHLTEDHPTQLSLLNTLQLLSATATNCNHMLSAGAAQLICEALTLPDSNHQIPFACIEILWNLLEHGSQIQVTQQLSSLKCISILRQVFHTLMATSSSQQSKQLRNDLLTISSLIARLCPDAPFVETGFLQDLCVFATSPEVDVGIRKEPRDFHLTCEREDFELKKGLTCILTILSVDKAAVKVMSSQRVVRSLLSFVVQNDKAVGEWSSAQFEELQLLALSCLSALAPLCPEDYMTCQGNTRILLLIEWCTKGDSKFKGHGNSFHGVGGRGSNLAQLRYCLRLLFSVCSSGDEVVHMDLHEQGAIPLLIGLLQQFLGVNSDGGSGTVDLDGPILLEMQSDILLIISCLCETDMHRKELFGGYDGVKLLVGCLKHDTGKFSSGLGHHRLLLAATDCVWCTVVGNSVVEDIFLENEGVFVLLDLLKLCPDNMQNLVLGVLVDLCENPKAIPHVVAWRAPDDNDHSVWSLLAKLWRKEEQEMGVPREYMNTLAGTLQPLMGVEQSACGVPPISSCCPSAAVIDITENMRAKIYTLCCKMGFQYPKDKLSTEDKITLHIVESYLDFKAGEVWNEVAGELAQEGLRPVSPDQECLQDIMHTHEEKAEETLKLQHDLIEEQKEDDLNEERQFYEKIKQYHHLEEKEKRVGEAFVKRTSNYKTLQEAKRRQLASIDASRASSVGIGDRFHSLEQHNLNVTTFCGRHVSIATTPMKLLALNDVTPSPRQAIPET